MCIYIYLCVCMCVCVYLYLSTYVVRDVSRTNDAILAMYMSICHALLVMYYNVCYSSLFNEKSLNTNSVLACCGVPILYVTYISMLYYTFTRQPRQ